MVVTRRVTRKRLSTRTHAMQVTTRHVCLEHSMMGMMLAPSRPIGISSRTKATVQANVYPLRSYSRRAQAQRPSVLLTALGCPAHLWAGMDLTRLVNPLHLRLRAERPRHLPLFLDVPALGQALLQLLRHFPGPLRPCFSPSHSNARSPTVTSHTSRPMVSSIT